MDVDPETLLFTQDSIKNTFKEPRANERIDDAVDSILSGELEASDFPTLSVVSYGGRFWSLDNRRLWVFKKAGVPSITVKLKSPNGNPRFTELITCNQQLMRRILKPGYWPRVRGSCRSIFHRPEQNFYSYLPVEPTPPVRSTSETDHDDVRDQDDNSRYRYSVRSYSARRVRPVPTVLGECCPCDIPNSTSAGNAESHPAVKLLGARESKPTTDKKTPDGEKSDSEVECARHDGIQMPMQVAASDIDLKVDQYLKAGPALFEQNQKFVPTIPKFGFKEYDEVLEAQKDKCVGNGGRPVEENGVTVTFTETDTVIAIVEGSEDHALVAPCDGDPLGVSHCDDMLTNALYLSEAAKYSSSDLGTHGHAKVDIDPLRTFMLPQEERYSRSSAGLRGLLEEFFKFVMNVAQSTFMTLKVAVQKIVSFTKWAWNTASRFFAK